MQVLTYTECNLFALAILLLIYLNIRHRSDYLFGQKLFLTLLMLNASILVLDSLMWVLDGKPGAVIRIIYLLVTVLYYILNPVICFAWSFYADYQIYRDEHRFKKLFIPMLMPVCLNTVLSVCSAFFNCLFYIDENNIYHRGQLFWLMAVLSYIYLVYTIIFIIINQHKVNKSHFIPILVFAIPPFLGGIIQSVFYGISIIWICMTVSIMIIFLNVQNDQLYTDHLTGVFNRRQLDHFLQEKMQIGINKQPLAGIMIDLNCFKMINDKYGHSTGDQALEHTAYLLKKTFRKEDFIARYGGDEFVVIMPIQNKKDLTAAVERLQNNVNRFNAEESEPYMLSLSVGYDYVGWEHAASAQEFLKHIDALMYEDKKKQHADIE